MAGFELSTEGRPAGGFRWGKIVVTPEAGGLHHRYDRHVAQP